MRVICIDARHAESALKMQVNKTDEKDAEGIAQITRTGWFRAVHVKPFQVQLQRSLLLGSFIAGLKTRGLESRSFHRQWQVK